MKTISPLKIAIQASGRLSAKSRSLLKSIGFNFEINDRALITPTQSGDLEILAVRDDDIPQYVAQGVADFGIVGENTLLEGNFPVSIVKPLGFCRCKLVIAAPVNSTILVSEDLTSERVATSYPNILSKFLQSRKISASIITLKGSVEIAPSLNLADAICDLTQTGDTLRQNNLRVITEILNSQAVLITNSTKNYRKQEFISRLESLYDSPTGLKNSSY